MKNSRLLRFVLAVFGLFAFISFVNYGNELRAQSAEPSSSDSDEVEKYQLGPDSQPQAGVPKGKTFSFQYEDSKIYPGTIHTISVYVPAEYRGDNPACVYMGIGKLNFNVPVVFDNLIYKHEMPVTIAIGVSAGIVRSADKKENPRFNRSFEFDSLNDSLARFITEEIFPAVETHKTPDGLPIKLSRDPNDHCAGGASTPGIAAFTLAWERPDLFRRVFTAVGTFVCMRGGDRYPVLVRETEPKPIRVFQQDGSNDEWPGGPEVGDWWMSNQTLERALEFAGYDHQHVWGTGKHNANQADAIFPDAMRYLWKDWPKPVLAQAAKTQNVTLQATIDPNSSWQLVSDTGNTCDNLAVNFRGEIFFHDLAAGRTRDLNTNGIIGDEPAIAADKAFAFAGDGRAITAPDFNAACLTVTSKGYVYATDAEAGKVWLIKPDGTKTSLDEGLNGPTGIALSPDNLWLVVMENRTHFGYSYRVLADGTVDCKERIYWAHVPDWADDSGAGSMCMDRDGYLYVATRMGVQIFDRNGRSRAILPMPTGEATSVCFGGAKFDTLFVISGGQLYKRHMKAIGAPAFEAPIKLPDSGPG